LAFPRASVEVERLPRYWSGVKGKHPKEPYRRFHLYRPVLTQSPDSDRRRPSEAGSSEHTANVPAVLTGASSVHRFAAADQLSIARFMAEDSTASALICGDSEAVLSRLPAGIFQSCVTSPQCWSLRDYGVSGQIGLEDSVSGYIDRLAINVLAAASGAQERRYTLG